MKYNNYYGVQRPWSLPSWLGKALAAFFCFIAFLSVVFMVQLLRMSHAQTLPPPVAAPASLMAQAEPVAPSVTKPAAKIMKTASKRSAQHKASKHALAAKIDKLNRHNQAVLARHDSRPKRREKDALDRVLGL